jgi:hypothetical protein
MKKKLTSFLECLLILIAFGGFVFFIGWTQFKIEPNNVGILISKTSGINNKPIYPGTFSWHWEFLIPTNAQLKMFTQEPYIISKEVKRGISPDHLSNIATEKFAPTEAREYFFDFIRHAKRIKAENPQSGLTDLEFSEMSNRELQELLADESNGIMARLQEIKH